MPTASNAVPSEQGICFFCKCIDKQENLVAAGTIYETKTKTQIDHVKNMTVNWIEMAKVYWFKFLMGMLLQTGCIIINPVLNVAIKYIENDILKELKEKDKDDEKTSVERWFKVHSLKKVIHYIKQTENENPGRIFEVNQLENAYI